MSKVILSMFVVLFELVPMGVASAGLGSMEQTAQSSDDVLFFPAPVAADNTIVAGNQGGR